MRKTAEATVKAALFRFSRGGRGGEAASGREGQATDWRCNLCGESNWTIRKKFVGGERDRQGFPKRYFWLKVRKNHLHEETLAQGAAKASAPGRTCHSAQRGPTAVSPPQTRPPHWSNWPRWRSALGRCQQTL